MKTILIAMASAACLLAASAPRAVADHDEEGGVAGTGGRSELADESESVDESDRDEDTDGDTDKSDDDRDRRDTGDGTGDSGG